MSTEPRRPGRPGADSRDDVREALLDAARERIIAVGFAAASVKDIADVASVNPAMISYYFGSKAALGEAMFVQALEPLRKQLEQFAGSTSDIEDFVSAYMRALSQHLDIPRLVAREVLPPNGQFRSLFFEQIAARGVGVLQRAVQAAQRSGRIDPDADIEAMSICIISLAVFPFLAEPIIASRLNLQLDDPATVDRLVAQTLAVLRHGFITPSKAES